MCHLVSLGWFLMVATVARCFNRLMGLDKGLEL